MTVPGRFSSRVWSLVFLVLAGTSCVPPLDDPETTPPARASKRRRPDPAPAAADAPPSSCADGAEGFDGWVAAFGSYAIRQGISRRTVEGALGDVVYDPSVVALDRSQHAFHHSFEELVEKRVGAGRVSRGRALLVSHATLLAEIEAKYGVPREVLVALWGLETDFGHNVGSFSAFRALATLAYDCRRAERFRGELLAALRIVDRGDMEPAAMVGAWAGEIGQTQFLPSSYEKYAVDFDHDGRADLVGSSADALASTASFLAGHGFRRGERYAEGTPNFAVLGEWNASEMYRRIIVYFAEKLAATRPEPHPKGKRPRR